MFAVEASPAISTVHTRMYVTKIFSLLYVFHCSHFPSLLIVCPTVLHIFSCYGCFVVTAALLILLSNVNLPKRLGKEISRRR